MAVPNRLFKVFTAFKGLDLRSSDILRSNEAATQLQNMTFRQTGAMNKRKGWQIKDRSGNGGSYGLTTFNNINTTTGAVTEEIIGIDDNLSKLTDHTFTITYTGSNTGVYYDVYLHTDGSFYFDVYDNYTRVLNKNLGTGLESSGRITVGTTATATSLVKAINDLTDFTCSNPTPTGTETNSAAFIPVADNVDISSSGTTVTYQAWVDIDVPTAFDNPVTTGQSTPFYTFYNNITDSTFENATFAQINDVLYIATGYDELMKYDGNRVYRAGLPKAYNAVAQGATGTAVATGKSASYKIRYAYVDAKGNEVTGTLSDVDTYDNSSGATKDVTVTVDNMQDGTAGIAGESGARGFNTNQVIVDGNQTASNILVDDSSTIKAGDYLYVDNSGTVTSLKVTAVPDSTHVTLESSVTVVDNDILSVVKIEVYRTEDYTTGGSAGLYYLTKELVNDKDNATQAFTDSTASSSLSANVQLVEPLKAHDEPPKARYCDVWRGQLILAGDRANTNVTYYSDIDSPEYFPAASNAFNADNKITGLKALDNILYVFKERSIDGVSGELYNDNFQVDLVSRDGVGCVAHHTIQEVRQRLFFLSDQGVYTISSAGVEDVGAPIFPKFQAGNTFTFSSAVAYNWLAKNQYVLFMPTLATASNPSLSTNATDEVYVFDYFRKAWLEWESWNFMGGATEAGGELYLSRRLSSNIDTVRVLQTGTKQDYNDHQTAITWVFKSNWMTLDEPSIWKKFLRCKIHSYDTSVNDFENDAFSVTLKTEHDYNNAKTWATITYDFSGGAAGWGLGPWGQFPWGEIRLSQLKKKLASKKVRSMRLILQNSTISENVLISGYELEVVAPYKAALKE